MRPPVMRIAVASVALLTIAAFCRAGHQTQSRSNMILIVSDALRADVLGCYGGEASTPSIDWLSAHGTTFDNAFSTSTWTGASCVSMFTANYPGSYPSETLEKQGKQKFVFSVPDAETLFTERLCAAGWDVVCYTENKLPRFNNVLQGYRRFIREEDLGATDRMRVQRHLHIDPEKQETTALGVLDYLLKQDEGQRFFLHIWFIDPHSPYCPPEDLLEQIAVDGGRLPRPHSHYREIRSQEVKEEARHFSDYEVRYLKRLYLAEVESIDRRVGYILKALRHRGLLESTCIILTSDHGEAFGENGLFCHGGGEFFDVLTHVPLIMCGPGVPRGRRVGANVSHIGLAPTVLDIVGVEPGEETQGRSFISHLHRDIPCGPVYFCDAGSQNCAVRDGRWKLMISEERTRLFDLGTDPGEAIDLSSQYPEQVARLAGIAGAIGRANGARREIFRAAAEPVSAGSGDHRTDREKLLRELRALGYVR